MNGRLAKRYARALLDLARGDGALEAVGEELARATAAFQEPRLCAVLQSPAIDVDARLRIARETVDALGVPPVVANLLRLLAERQRLGVLPEVEKAYEGMVDDALGRARVTIRSAAALTASERTEVTELARRLTGRREVLVQTEVVPELLGGVVLDTGGTVYDGSVRTQLQRFGQEMAARST